MTTERLILKRVSASRSSGEWNDDDFDVAKGEDAMKRAKDTRFEKVGGVPCAIIVCEDETEVAVPAEAFLALAPKARQHLQSTNTPLVAGEWVAARYYQASQIRTGTTDNGRVALQFDPGSDSEICLSLDPKTARDLGQALVTRPAPPSFLDKKH